jgi:signal peptidase II
VAVTAIGVAMAPSVIGWPVAVGLGLVVGGAGGNLLDRLERGAVLDFVAAGPWPSFNLADAALVGGTLLSVAGLR